VATPSRGGRLFRLPRHWWRGRVPSFRRSIPCPPSIFLSPHWCGNPVLGGPDAGPGQVWAEDGRPSPEAMPSVPV